MKQSKFKTLGLVLSGILLFSTGIQASSMISKVNATLDKSMSMTWNNQQFKPTERDGSVVHPILYNDRTYLPVKFIAEKAGIQVEWDSKTKTVGLTQYERPIVNTSPKVDTYEKKYNDAINTNKELEKKIERLERDYKNAKNNVKNLKEELGELDIKLNAQDRIDRQAKEKEAKQREELLKKENELVDKQIEEMEQRQKDLRLQEEKRKKEELLRKMREQDGNTGSYINGLGEEVWR